MKKRSTSKKLNEQASPKATKESTRDSLRRSNQFLEDANKHLRKANEILAHYEAPKAEQEKRKKPCNSCIHKNGCGLSQADDIDSQSLCAGMLSLLTVHYSDTLTKRKRVMVIPEGQGDWTLRLEDFMETHLQ